MWSELGPVARHRADLTSVIEEVATTWARFGDPDGFVAWELDSLKVRLTDQRATIGVFGLIKRGKSTLVNALVGADASRTRAVPETAVPVRVTYAEEHTARVHLLDGHVEEVDPSDAHLYTSQADNAGNRRGVVLVERGVPSTVLSSGVDVIDLPGLDDAEADETYTARTLQQLDTVDAGIVVFQSPPTVSGTELAFLQQIVDRHRRKVVVVCNLYPQHFDDVDTRKAVVDYTAQQLRARGLGTVELVPVCALRLWEAARDGDRVMWGEGGGYQLDDVLEHTLLHNLQSGPLRRTSQDLARVLQVALGQVELLERGSGARSDAITNALRRRLEEPAGQADDRRRGIDGVRVQARSIVQQVVRSTEDALGRAGSIDQVRTELDRFRRALEVQTEQATRIVLRQLVDDPERRDTLVGELAEWGDAGVVMHAVDTPGRAAVAGGAALGGVLGGAGLTLLATALGPVGLIAGALAGSWIGRSAARSSTVREAREEALRALTQIADQILEDLDVRTQVALNVVERRERARRAAFETDLRRVLHLLDGDERSWADQTASVRELCLRADEVAGAHDPDRVVPSAV